MEKKVLKASAGTGKTYRLSLEYVVSLFMGEKIKDIVVMTFTRKAVAEIKEDIIKFVKKLALDPTNEDEESERLSAVNSIKEIYKDTFGTDEEIYKKAKKAYKDIILNKDNLKIFTIDSLRNNIFKSAIAPMLNINSYEIIDGNQNTEYLRKCFEKIFKNKKDFDLLKEFLDENAEKNIDKYVEIIKNIVDERWKYFLIEKKERKPYKIEKDLDEVDSSIEIIKKIAEEKGKSVEEFVNSAYRKYLLLDNYEEKEKFLINKWADVFSSNIKNGSKIKGKKLESEIEELDHLYLNLLEGLAKRIYNNILINYEKNVFSFLEKIYSTYDEIKFKEKRFTQNDITNYTLLYINDKKLNLIGEDEKITDYMREILESGVSTVFIDEFQDTSVVQWKILKSIITSAKKVICVGDEKQSIYEWRGGEKDLFINLSKIIDAKEETLGTSYRSRKKIVDFTNEYFTRHSELAKRDNIKWNFSPLASIDTKDRGHVEIQRYVTEDNKPCEKIANVIKENFKGNYNGIAILARENGTLKEMAECLSDYHIPYFLETNRSIFFHRTITPIIKLIRYLVYDNIFYLAEFLRDDFTFISDKNLKSILLFLKNKDLKNEDIENFKFEDKYSNEILKKVLKFREKYNKNRYENISLVEEIIKDFKILKKYDRESDIQNVYDFIEISKEFLNLREFLNEINENEETEKYKQSSLETSNGVLLLTIHKSKGLGFDTVFYIHKDVRDKKDLSLGFNAVMSDDYKKVKNYFIIKSSYEKILKYLEGEFDIENYKKLKKAEEEINNLYVAFTRAKENLFIIISEKARKTPPKELPAFKEIMNEKYLSVSENWSEGDFLLKTKPEDKEIKDISDIKDIGFEIDFSKYEYDSEKLEENRENLLKDEKRYTTEREEKREMGNIVHYFLENLIYNTDEERRKAKKEVISKYGASFGKEKIKNILDSKVINDFLLENSEIFLKDWDYIYPEYSIYSDEDTKLYRIDRLMIRLPKENKKGRILIVDYKTGGYEESQIERYYIAIKSRIKNPEDYIIDKKYLQINFNENEND